MLKSAVAGVVLGLATLTMSGSASAGLSAGPTLNFNATESNSTCYSLTGEIDYQWDESSPGGTCPEDDFEARARTGVIAPFSGPVTFCGSHDDGMELTVDGEVLFSNLDYQGMEDPCNSTGEITLVEGECYPLEIFFYEAGGNAGIRLSWEWNGGEYVVIPASAYDNSCASSGDIDFNIDVRGLLPRTGETLPETGSNLAVPLTLGGVFLSLGLVLVRRRGVMPAR